MAQAARVPVFTRDDLAQLTWIVRRYALRYAPRLLLAMLCVLAAAGTMGGLLATIRPVFDDLLLGGDRTLAFVLPARIVALATAGGLLIYANAVLTATVNERVDALIQGDLHAALIEADQRELDRIATGDIMMVLTANAGAAASGITTSIMLLARDAIQAVVLTGLMLAHDWQLTLIVLLSLPLLGLGMRRIHARIRALLGTSLELAQQAMRMIGETLLGARVVKLQGMEAAEAARFRAALAERRRMGTRLARAAAAPTPLNELVGGVGVGAIVIFAAWRAGHGGPSIGAMAAFLGALLVAYQPIKRITAHLTQMQQGIVAARNVRRYLELRPTIVDAPDARPLELRAGRIEFAGVGFGYDPDRKVLHDVTFAVERGRTAALVGPSGGGKSTLLALLVRLYDVQDGAIAIDGADIRGVTLESLRAAIAYVGQEPVLFDDTIGANIAYGVPDADQARIEAAARAAGAHEFIAALPLGYATPAGERGALLSGGQKQRIALARAFLRDAPILLLDEATSSLDNRTELAVRQALHSFGRNRTVIVVAHRLGTVVDADCIHVVDGGRIIESGSHAELVRRGGLYAALHAAQSVPGAA